VEIVVHVAVEEADQRFVANVLGEGRDDGSIAVKCS